MLVSTTPTSSLECERQHRPRRVGADAGQRQQLRRGRRGHLTVVPASTTAAPSGAALAADAGSRVRSTQSSRSASDAAAQGRRRRPTRGGTPSHSGTTRATWVCCSITSLTSTAHGSRVCAPREIARGSPHPRRGAGFCARQSNRQRDVAQWRRVRYGKGTSRAGQVGWVGDELADRVEHVALPVGLERRDVAHRPGALDQPGRRAGLRVGEHGATAPARTRRRRRRPSPSRCPDGGGTDERPRPAPASRRRWVQSRIQRTRSGPARSRS